jgi:hypothetical protein
MQGKLGLRPGWPGDAVFPPQPLRSQLNAFLRDYEQCGGRVTRAEFPDCGHSPFVEKPLRFQELLGRADRDRGRAMKPATQRFPQRQPGS